MSWMDDFTLENTEQYHSKVEEKKFDGTSSELKTSPDAHLGATECA